MSYIGHSIYKRSENERAELPVKANKSSTLRGTPYILGGLLVMAGFSNSLVFAQDAAFKDSLSQERAQDHTQLQGKQLKLKDTSEFKQIERKLNAKEDAEARRLFQAVSNLLSETATQRHAANKLPSENDFLVSPLWTATRESRMRDVQELLNAALDVVTDVPLVTIQKRIDTANANINTIENQITSLREKKLSAPKDALLPGILSDTVASLDDEIEDLNKRILANKTEINNAKSDVQAALRSSGIEVTSDQLELLLGSVLGGDLIKMVAAFDASRKIDERLADLMTASGGEIKTSRRYFAMHAALFAMLVHAQTHVIDKIDQVYLKRMGNILAEIRRARAETRRLLRGDNRADQVRVLNANLKAQAFSERVALFYRDYLKTQRNQLHNARMRSTRDLRIADNTYSTVEASFQLRALIDDAKSSFKALQMLEAPGFEEVFKNKELREEFENLTEKLIPPSS